MLQACDAIAEAHSLGIVHRDIKPTNLFVTKRRDGSELLKVLDFGISKATLGPDMSLTQTQSMLGTPAYMSPEQMRSARTVDRRSDIWSLGCVLYELVEGHAPFEAENFAELCVMVALEPFTPVAQAPELSAVIDRVLAKKADDRFQDVAELAYALEPFASDPERAHRQVMRVFRVLGRPHPDGRDSTPMGLDRHPSQPRLGSRPSYPALPQPAAIPRTPTPSFVIPSSRWKTFAVLGLVCGIGIAAALFVLDASSDDPPAPAAQDWIEPAAPVDLNQMTVERADAGVDAAVIAPAVPTTTTTTTTTVRPKPTVRKQPPPRKLVKPTSKPTPPKPTLPKPTPPAPPKCDPFDNPNGCS
jgi:serine/threonine-protein kinase